MKKDLKKHMRPNVDEKRPDYFYLSSRPNKRKEDEIFLRERTKKDRRKLYCYVEKKINRNNYQYHITRKSS